MTKSRTRWLATCAVGSMLVVATAGPVAAESWAEIDAASLDSTVSPAVDVAIWAEIDFPRHQRPAVRP